jgi:flagella basal body P-ring formation protein FlgA
MPIVGVALAVCVAVSAASDRIVAGDLAPVSPAFAALAPDAMIGWAPGPGVRRDFPVAELRRVATRLGAPALPETGACFERTVTPLDPSRILGVIQPQVPEGPVMLVDFSRAPVPEGELVLPRNSMRRAPGNTYLWSGYVRYAGNRRFRLWARVSARAAVPVVAAAADLQSGRALERQDVRLETRNDLFASGLVASLEDALGKWPRRPIRAGAALAAEWLEPAPDVARGETVKVEIWSGGAHLEMDARAEGAAAVGQPVAVRNPVSQKRFLGLVEGRGRVSVGHRLPDEKPDKKEMP